MSLIKLETHCRSLCRPPIGAEKASIRSPESPLTICWILLRVATGRTGALTIMNGGHHRYSGSRGGGSGGKGGGGGNRGGFGGGGGGRQSFGGGGGRRGGRGNRRGGSQNMGGATQEPSYVCCFQFLQGKCSFGDQCRFVHGASYVGNAVANAHSGEVKSLGRDNTAIYSVGDDMAINTFSYAPGTGISSTGTHTLRGSGTFFVCSEPTKQFYFTAYTSPLFPTGSTAKPYPHQVTGQVQMTCNSTTLDLLISPDKPFVDQERVNCITAWEVPDASTGATLPHVFTGGQDGVIRVWSVESATNQFKLVASLEGHTRGVTALVIITSGETYLWSSSLDGTLRVWNPQTYALQCIIAPGGLYNPADRSVLQASETFQTGPLTDMLKMEHASESYLVVGSKDGSIFIYTTTGQVIHQSPALKPMTDIDAGGVIHLAIAYKGTDQYLLAAYDTGYLVLWTLPHLEVYCMIDPRNIGRPPPSGYQNQGPPPATLITSLLSLDNEVFITGTNDGAIRCWSIV